MIYETSEEREILVKKQSDRYESLSGLTVLAREYGNSPNGNPLDGRWVLRHHGKLVDFGRYRYDLAEKYHLDLRKKA